MRRGSIADGDRVFRVGFVPHGDQLVACLADVLAVDDVAGEDTSHNQGALEEAIHAVLPVEDAHQMVMVSEGLKGGVLFRALSSNSLTGRAGAGVQLGR